MTTWRHLELSPARLPRWWAKFTADHPGVDLTIAGGTAALTSTNGSVARFTGWFPITDADLARPVAAVQARLLASPKRIGVVLVRRGGYAIGLAEARDDHGYGLAAHRCGTRYVQGRTAAGGQSQQRFARRRDNQAADLVRTAADRAAAVLEPILAGAGSDGADIGLALGGDPALAERVLADPRLRPLARAPRREFFDLPDPRFTVLTAVTERLGTVRVAVHNPA